MRTTNTQIIKKLRWHMSWTTAPLPCSGRSWWVGLTREELTAATRIEQARMTRSRYGRILESKISYE